MSKKEINKTIVLVEDREEDILLMKRIISKSDTNIDLKIFNDSEETNELILNDSFRKIRPNLIILDINMPKINGLELLKNLRSNKIYDKIPIIIFSSSTHQNDINKSYEYHANSFIQKPKTFLELKNVLTTITNYWLNNNIS